MKDYLLCQDFIEAIMLDFAGRLEGETDDAKIAAFRDEWVSKLDQAFDVAEHKDS